MQQKAVLRTRGLSRPAGPPRSRARILSPVVALAVILAIVGALTFAYAKSGPSAFNLNSPASFPVDI